MCCFEEQEPKENLCAECLTKFKEYNKYNKRELFILLKAERLFRCGNERPDRKILCQLTQYHKGSHQASVFWEDDALSTEMLVEFKDYTEIEETHFELCKKLHESWDDLPKNVQDKINDNVYAHYEP